MSVQSFIQQIAPTAVDACINTGVFPSVVIGQAIQESGAGNAPIARKFNNLFGHVASASWDGKTGRTTPHGKLWRWYDSVADAISEHIDVLKKPLYRLAGAFKAKSPYEQLLAIQKAGYNAGPDRDQYAIKIAKIIKQYHLEQYDAQMIAKERMQNSDNLAYSERDGFTRTMQNIFS